MAWRAARPSPAPCTASRHLSGEDRRSAEEAPTDQARGITNDCHAPRFSQREVACTLTGNPARRLMALFCRSFLCRHRWQAIRNHDNTAHRAEGGEPFPLFDSHRTPPRPGGSPPAPAVQTPNTCARRPTLRRSWGGPVRGQTHMDSTLNLKSSQTTAHPALSCDLCFHPPSIALRGGRLLWVALL